MSGRAQGLLAAAGIALLGLALLWRHSLAQARLAGQVDGYEQGLADGLRINPPPVDPALGELDRCRDLSVCQERVAELELELSGASAAADWAREQGLEEGLRLGREDWRPLPRDCRAGLSPLGVLLSP